MKNNEMKVEVMLDIFSGRPNPKWELSEEQVKEFKTKLGTLPAGKQKMPPALGYRGIRILNVGRIEGIPDRIKAYDGVLAIAEKGETNYYEDINKIEDWLKSTTQRRLWRGY